VCIIRTYSETHDGGQLNLQKICYAIKNNIYKKFYTQESRSLIGGSIDDIQLAIDYSEEAFKIFLRGGPIKKGEAFKYLNFQSEELKNCGLFLDLDFFKEEPIKHENIPQLINTATAMTWKKLETIARGLGY